MLNVYKHNFPICFLTEGSGDERSSTWLTLTSHPLHVEGTCRCRRCRCCRHYCHWKYPRTGMATEKQKGDKRRQRMMQMWPKH